MTDWINGTERLYWEQSTY